MRLIKRPESPQVANHKETRPIRVLFIIDTLCDVGGAEGCLLRMTKHLPRDQFECSVLTFHTAEGSAKFIEQFDCPVYAWQINNLYDRRAFQVAKQLYRFIRDQQIDIVHTFFQTSDLWAGPIAKLAGAKVHISSRRDMGYHRKRWHRIGYRLMRRVFDQVQTVSEAVRQYTLEEDGVDPTRMLTIHNGIDSNLHVPDQAVEKVRVRYDFPLGPPVIIVVANIRPVKGIDILVRAAAIVAKQILDVNVLIVGNFGKGLVSQKYTKEINQLSERLGVSSCVRSLGPSDHVAELLSLSDIYVAPSRSEGLSNALLEAMRAGLPCVVTAVGGNPEVVVDGKTGFVVPSEDPEAMAGRILQLLRDPELRRSMGRAGRERFLNYFTAQTMTSQIVAAYGEALSKKRGGPLGRPAVGSTVVTGVQSII
jgi:glycosyltransferase involved in cell wall biosynthesis